MQLVQEGWTCFQCNLLIVAKFLKTSNCRLKYSNPSLSLPFHEILLVALCLMLCTAVKIPFDSLVKWLIICKCLRKTALNTFQIQCISNLLLDKFGRIFQICIMLKTKRLIMNHPLGESFLVSPCFAFSFLMFEKRFKRYKLGKRFKRTLLNVPKLRNAFISKHHWWLLCELESPHFKLSSRSDPFL